MLKVGLTGGIGSGKTVVGKVFSILGIPVYDADSNAKLLMESNGELKRSIKKDFGNEIYKNGKLDRKKLASIVFNSKNKLHHLNSLIHPVVQKDFKKWAEKQQNAPYVIEESAILIENTLYKKFDAMILVTAPVAKRIERVVRRDKTDKQEVLKRMYNQLSDDIKKDFVDFIILNDDKALIIPQILKIHLQLKNKKWKKY